MVTIAINNKSQNLSITPKYLHKTSYFDLQQNTTTNYHRKGYYPCLQKKKTIQVPPSRESGYLETSTITNKYDNIKNKDVFEYYQYLIITKNYSSPLNDDGLISW